MSLQIPIAAAGNVVLNERVDVFTHESGGTITIEKGAITVWRDYFDPADFDRQLAQIKR